MITQLYPTHEEQPLNGLYLAHRVRAEPTHPNRPFVYGNFVTSLDGRIAIPHPSGNGLMVPPNVANDRDWRLFQELAAQADLIISSGRYLRDWADGRAQEILRVDDPKFSDLREWRQSRGLSAQPDIAVISSRLDFPIPRELTANNRRVIVFTTEQADPKRVEEVKAEAGQVLIVGASTVDGYQMAKRMKQMNYNTVYSAAGPKILHLLLSAGVLDRLYLTQTGRMLGGNPFSTIVEGSLFPTALDFRLSRLYWDPDALPVGQTTSSASVGQLLLSYDKLG